MPGTPVRSASPACPPRSGQQIKDLDWALSSGDPLFQSYWPQKLWKTDKVYQFTGGPGGYGVGYSAPAAVGAALAHRAHGRFVVNIQGDGELMCCPGALWTAVHHKIPLLTVMHNNRAYHQELMHVQRMADRHARGIDRARIGTAIDDPAIDYAKLAQSMGMWATGPVSDPNDLGPTLRQSHRRGQKRRARPDRSHLPAALKGAKMHARICNRSRSPPAWPH